MRASREMLARDDHDVVERAGNEIAFAVGVVENGLQDEARTQQQIARGDVGQDFFDFRFGHGGQEAEAADVHAEDRHLRGKDRIDDVDERAVAARDQEEVRFFRQFGFGDAGPADQRAGPLLKEEPEVGVSLRRTR